MFDGGYLPSMSLPGGVSMVIDEDELLDEIGLDEHRTLFISPEKAVVHRERSLLTDESVDTYPTAARKLGIEEGKRQTVVTFEYPNQPDLELELPSDVVAPALKALLASIIKATGVVSGDESIRELYRFNELTVVLTDSRLLKHIGHALWADMYDVIEFENIRDIRTEEGQVSTGINIVTTASSDRLKVPHEAAEGFVTELEQAVCDYHDVAALGVLRGDPDAAEPDPEPDLDQLRPLSVTEEDSVGESEGLLADLEPPDPAEDTDLHTQLQQLTAAIEQQHELLESYMETLERLERELTRDR